jgi:hypothetical protein
MIAGEIYIVVAKQSVLGTKAAITVHTDGVDIAAKRAQILKFKETALGGYKPDDALRIVYGGGGWHATGGAQAG